MILSSIRNLENHGIDRIFEESLLDHMREGKDHAAGSRQTLNNGMYCFDSECMTVNNIDSAMLFENHNKLIDIHLIIEGVERVLVDDPDMLVRAADYDEDKDKEFFRSDGIPCHRLLLRAGEFAVLYPGEAHLCCLADDEPAVLKKRVYKIPVSKDWIS